MMEAAWRTPALHRIWRAAEALTGSACSEWPLPVFGSRLRRGRPRRRPTTRIVRGVPGKIPTAPQGRIRISSRTNGSARCRAAHLIRYGDEEHTMSVPCKFELSVLNHDEQEFILNTHHPAVGESERNTLEGLRVRLRDLRDRERTLERHRRRQTKGTADPRGKSFSGTHEHANTRQQIFASAIKRVNKELARIRKFEARRELGAAARRALALRRAYQFDRPQSAPTPREGMRSLPSRRRTMKVPPGKIGRILQANKRAQARRDQRGG